MRKNNFCGMDSIGAGKNPVGFYAYVRKFELAAAINRLRTLQIKK